MIWILLIVVVLISVFPLVGWMLSAPRYKGPVTDHFNGRTFSSPGNVKPRGFADLLKWMFNRKRAKWEKVNASFGPPPPVSVGKGELRVTFINHCTFLIQVDGINILTDPIWSERASPFTWMGPKRMRPPGLKMEDIPHIDVLLISHNHYDHLDVSSVKKIVAKHHPKIYTALGVKAFLDQQKILNSHEMDWGDEVMINNDLSLACVPAQHFSARGMFDRDATLWCGFVVRSVHGNIYFAADTGYASFIKKIGETYSPLRLSILPVGAYKPEWFMSPVHASPAESVQMHIDIHSHKTVASHFGTFPLADEEMYEPVEALADALKQQHIPAEDFIALKEGEGMNIDPLKQVSPSYASKPYQKRS